MAGLPRALTVAPLRVVRPQDLSEVYTQPSVQLARLVRQGRVHRIAHGFYVVPPDDAPLSWEPTLEAVAAGVATAIFAQRVPVLMHLSAARLHGALPRAIGNAFVAVPRQHAPVPLLDDRSSTVIFVARDVDALDSVLQPTDLGPTLVTGIEQTIVDLARRPALGGLATEARAAAMDLWPRADQAVLDDLAGRQRAVSPVARLRSLVSAA